MEPMKDRAKQIIDALPDEVTWDDLVYGFYVRAKIQAGIEAAEAGRVVPHEEVVRRFRSRDK